MENLKISIPKPCHENWYAMSPAAQGRFCSSCSKTVIDFSVKTKKEVREFINNNSDKKLCGRFRNDQLTEEVKINISIDALKQKLKPYQAFAMALLLAFGTTLFSCTTQQGNMVGELAIVQKPDIQEVDTIVTESMVNGMMLYTMPELKLIEQPIENNNEAMEDSLSLKDTVQLNTVDVRDKVFSYDPGMMTLGGISFCRIIENTVVVNETDSVNTKQVDQFEKSDPVVNIYPNPSSGIINLKLNFQTESNLKADLYDIKGSLIRNIIPYQLMQAELKNIPLDLREQPPGIYLLVVATDEKIYSERVVINK